MNKGVTNLPTYQQVARTANERYLEALSVVADPAPSYQQVSQFIESKVVRGRQAVSESGSKRRFPPILPLCGCIRGLQPPPLWARTAA